VSHAADNPVFCARKADLGCTASHPGGKHAAIRAAAEGWFRSSKAQLSFCPAHVPDWVPEWRAALAAKTATAGA
jgi:hypothetical protein